MRPMKPWISKSHCVSFFMQNVSASILDVVFRYPTQGVEVQQKGRSTLDPEPTNIENLLNTMHVHWFGEQVHCIE